MSRIFLILFFSLTLASCSVIYDEYPSNWGKRITIDSDNECQDISGSYIPYTPKGDLVHTNLLGAILCAKKEKVETDRIMYTQLDIIQHSSDSIKLLLLDNGRQAATYFLEKKEFICSKGKIILQCVKSKSMYFSGYCNQKISFEKNSKGSLIMNNRELGVGTIMGVPAFISKSRYFRFLPRDRAKPGQNAYSMPVAIPNKD